MNAVSGRVVLKRVIGVTIAAASLSYCGPTLPPTTVPPPPSQEYASFTASLQTYVDQTQPFRRQAAQLAEQVPGKTTPTKGAEASVRTRQNSLADALRTKLRPNATPGDLFGAAAAEIQTAIDKAFAGPRRDLLMDSLSEQNDEGEADGDGEKPEINQHVDAPRLPPLLIEVLPPLPKQLEYDFSGRELLLRDVDADVVVDILANALPELPPAGVPTVPPERASTIPSAGLPLPNVRGGSVFAAIGDSGSGDMPQERVAAAMLGYFTTGRRFPFVLMLGDNLYHDDYMNEFSVPYKPLTDRGVKFYAALGNHDRDLEIHFKPFNMQDRDYYSFDEGNVRFAALNSNHLYDPAQTKWVDDTFQNAGDKWRIAFFHHPLYSSGQHAGESRDVIRPAFESLMVRNRIDVVLSGHEHLYERIKPQKGVRYFVSGGGGRSLYDVHPSDFDEIAVSDHHFMVFEIAGDRMFFEAITPENRLLDCGLLWRTGVAAAKPDNDTTTWMNSCKTALAGPSRTQ